MTIQNIYTAGFRERSGFIGEGMADWLQTFLDWRQTSRLRHGHIPGKPGALDGDMTIEALPTCYAGVTFRSALEAGWARTLNSLDVQWQYEPKTITLPSGARYIPDFWLPEHGIWLEVKGTGVPRVEKAVELGETVACHCEGSCRCDWPGGEMVLIGHPPIDRTLRHGGHPVWSVTHGHRPFLARCPHCNRGGWSNTPYCRVCLLCLCSWREGTTAYFPGAVELEFLAVSGPAVAPSPAAVADPATAQPEGA